MAHYKRRRPRICSTARRYNRHMDMMAEKHGSNWWLGAWPRSHDILFHNRPRRRETKQLQHAVLRGADPDAIAWPLGNSRPHVYYW